MKGKTVRYNDEGLRYAQSHQRPNRQDNWHERTGIVLRLTKPVQSNGGARSAYVVWSGNKTYSDPVPLKFLEEV